eukprot:9353357-Prorocentrum_lima.AAC.1
MTSSLVGSEMCIRDRGNRHLPGFAGADQSLVWHWLKTNSYQAPYVYLPGCLLYTSDAADDM